MGTVLHSATFEGKHPDLADIVEKVTEIVGFPVEVTELAHDPEFDLYDLEAEIQLAGFPETMLELRCYRPGAVREYCGEGQDGFPMPEVVEGYEETEEVRKVHMQAYAGPASKCLNLGKCKVYPCPRLYRLKHPRPCSFHTHDLAA